MTLPYFVAPDTDALPTLLRTDGHVDRAGMKRQADAAVRRAHRKHVWDWYVQEYGLPTSDGEVWRAAARAIADRAKQARLQRERGQVISVY